MTGTVMVSRNPEPHEGIAPKELGGTTVGCCSPIQHASHSSRSSLAGAGRGRYLLRFTPVPPHAGEGSTVDREIRFAASPADARAVFDMESEFVSWFTPELGAESIEVPLHR